MSKQKAIASSKRNPCPICQKTHGCKISDNLVLCLRGDRNWSVPGYRFIKPLRGFMGGLFGTDSENHREYRPEPKPEPKSLTNITPLTDEQLDREARKIIKQLGLSTRHRQALRERGLTDEQIDDREYRSIDRYQEFNLIPINPNFPGMGNRGTLTNGGSGILIPIRNIKGLIIGFQLASDHREEGKYKWLVGSSERRVSGERPLQFLQLNNSNILDIIEGTLKPLIAAHLHNINVLGSGGTAWHGSPKEFKGIIDSGLFTQYILNPDAGCKFNHHVMGAYRSLFLFLKKHGITLYVRDWGQGDRPKSDKIDVDNIDTKTFNDASIIPYAEWDDSDELKTFLTQESTPTKNTVISEEEHFKRFTQPRLETKLVNIIKRFLPRKSQPKPEAKPATKPELKPSEAVNSSAITLWKPQPLISTTYVPGQLPTFAEWQSMGCPKIFFNEGQRLTLTSEIKERGFKFSLDTTATGHGKSFDAGRIDLKTFGINPNDKENKTRIFYLSADHRNPTNATVEANYVDLEARHPGLIYDHSRKTALGNPHVNRVNKNQTPDIPSNCPENGTFLTVSELGLPVFGGKESPICQSCPLLLNGCQFLETRRDTLKNERRIRADINSIPTPSSDDVLILDDLSLINTHQISIKIDEFLKTVGRLQLGDDERIFKVLRLILVAVYKALQSITTEKNKYGISHNQVMELMPKSDELNQLIWELYADDWLKADDVWGTPIWDYEMINGEPVATRIIGEISIAPSLKDIRNECYKIFENYAKFINGLQTPEEKQQAIKDNVIPSWLPALIDCLLGNKRINLRIENGKLTITKRSKRHQNIIKNAGFVIALDATQGKQDYALSLGISPDEVLEVAEVKQETPNLTIHPFKGLSAGKQRRDSMQRRINVAQSAIANRHQGQKIALIDHKSAIAAYDANDAKLGYWHKDTRGSNQFLRTQVFILVGKPIPNLGQMAAEYQTLTGYSPAPDKLTGHYGAWVKRKIQAELIQGVGRPRAHLRPGEEIHIYLVADLDDDTISAIRLAYPTATVTTEDIYDIAPEAASKGVQTARGIVDAVLSAIQDGITPKITKIAEAVGKAVGTVSETLNSKLGFGFKRLVEISEMLLEAINNKTEISDLPDDARWVAETFLPNVVADFERGDSTPVDVVADIITTAKAFGKKQFRQILAATPIPTVCKLFGAIVRFLPKSIKQAILTDFSQGVNIREGFTG